uniref:Uncharacterized protein n=1 Tax=Photinus pyralis TaxID=7054 RepID=A0A1Y1N6C7_PHOPY
MLLKDFYNNVILNEELAAAYLQERQLLDAAEDAEPCHRCGSEMQQKRRRDRNGEYRPIFRCPRKGCQTSHSVRKGNQFFHYTDVNNRLHCNLIPTNSTVTLTGKSSATVTDWFNMCREVCGSIIRTRRRMTGDDDNPIQIDEARFAGRRKYNRGRMLAGDGAPVSEDSDVEIQNNRNHGRRIDGP